MVDPDLESPNSHTSELGWWVKSFQFAACISGAKNFKDKPLASTAAEESLDERRVLWEMMLFFYDPS